MSASTSAAVVQQYREALGLLQGAGAEAPLLRRMSELIALLDLSTTFDAGLNSDETLGAALAIVMGATQATRGALFVRGDDGRFAIRASRALPAGAPPTLDVKALDEPRIVGPSEEARVRHGLVLLSPIRRRGQAIAVLGLGPRAGDVAYGAEECAFLRSVGACAAPAIENNLIHDELGRLNQKLSVKVFQLHNLFDISRELTGSFEEQAIQSLIATTVMGHFVVSRCGLYLMGPRGLALAHERGLRRGADSAPLPVEQARAALQELLAPRAVAELPDGPLRQRLEEARLVLAVPLTSGNRVEGLLALGDRASRTPFSSEDRDFAQTLARQAFAALEGARLNRLRVEKERQDHELQVAREIQRSLLPSRAPELPGFEVAAESRSCYEVGGDGYDWVPLEAGRLALVVADVSGKGTPASLLMASVSASVHALAGTVGPAPLMERLNRFLFARTQTNRYVTFFYAELDAASRRLAYVNAGHVPSYLVARDGTVRRLFEGGPALGLLEAASYETAQVGLEPGDVVAMVTDGVTEASDPDDREFGDERVCETLRARSGGNAASILEGLVAAVSGWTATAGFADDLTALVLKVS